MSGIKEGLGSRLCVLLLSVVFLWQSGGCQDVTVRVIQPTSQDRLCSNQTVVYECRISDPSFFLIWQHPTVTMNLLEFGVSSSVDVPVSTADGKFTATLTEVMVDGIRANFTSTLTILPPLSSLNGTELTCQGSTTIPVENSTIILLSGSPDSPRNLNQNVSTNTESSVMVQWDPPNYTGGEGISIIKYEVTADDQAMLVSSDGSGMTGNDMLNFTISGLAYNTAYDVSVTAINSCDLESEPATITVNIEARAPPTPDLFSPELLCGVSLEDGRPVVLRWMYGSEAYNVEYPGEVDVNVGLSPGDIFCSYVTVENSSCTVNITEDREYSIVISMENSVGTTVTVYPFKSDVLNLEYFLDSSAPQPFGLQATLNPLCAGRLSDYFVQVLFGVRQNGNEECLYLQSSIQKFSTSHTVFIEMDLRVESDIYEYCALAVLNGREKILFNDFRAECDPKSLSVGAVAAISVAISVLMSLSVGVLIGCWGAWCVRRQGRSRGGRGGKEPGGRGGTLQEMQQLPETIYEEPGLMDTAIHLSDNEAYGHVNRQRGN